MILIVGLFPWFSDARLFTHAYLGVDLFFLLSGFILAHNYVERMQRPTLADVGQFLWLRLARIYPVHLFTILVLLVLVTGANSAGYVLTQPDDFTLTAAVHNVLLLQAWGVSFGTWNTPSWSISAEWFAYLMFPLLIIAFARIRSTSFAWLGFLACYSIFFWTASSWGPGIAYLDGERSLLRVIAQFTAGMMLYRVYQNRWLSPRFWGVVVWIAFGAVVAYASLVERGPMLHMIPAPMMGLFILGLASSQGAWSKLLSSRPFVYWGEVSYALYMTHEIARLVFSKVLPGEPFRESALGVKFGVLLIFLTVVCAAAIFTYRFVEQPARNWMRRLVGMQPTVLALPKLAAPSSARSAA
jgi:peptidoglycan/LPS O-acetylase OafA/YrhL